MQSFIPIKLGLLSLAILILNGCVSTTPVIEKTQELSASNVTTESSTHHIVKRGETLYSIATRYGSNYKDIARWNQIAPPYALNVGQRLQLNGPPSNNESVTSTAARTPRIDNSPMPQPAQNVSVASKKRQQKKNSSKMTQNDSLNLIPADTKTFSDLMGEKHKILRKKIIVIGEAFQRVLKSEV
ncbi:lipoprotein NlpD [Beggiatoa sp. PS]|nr:lipoprotein NlpD [Beggiatoa sp. PS]